ncbi:MAG: hypothetical protein R3345_07560 [Fulvivirga sp.]|nr:hypothetical protein [Fulvivirga sp.]
MLKHFNKYIENIIITSLVVAVLTVSVVSWTQFVRTEDSQPQTLKITETQKLKNEAVVFSGMVLTVAKYLQIYYED